MNVFLKRAVTPDLHRCKRDPYKLSLQQRHIPFTLCFCDTAGGTRQGLLRGCACFSPQALFSHLEFGCRFFSQRVAEEVQLPDGAALPRLFLSAVSSGGNV